MTGNTYLPSLSILQNYSNSAYTGATKSYKRTRMDTLNLSFGSDGGMWALSILVSDHYLSFFTLLNRFCLKT